MAKKKSPRRKKTGQARRGRPAAAKKTGRTKKARAGKRSSTKKVSRKTMSQSKSSKKKPAGAAGQPKSLDKVRDLLFGAQIRDSESRFDQLEERMAAGMGDLREEIRRRFEALEKYLKSETESLVAQIKSEQNERTAADKALAKDLLTIGQTIDKRIRELDAHSRAEHQKLRKQILDQSKVLRDELNRSEQAQTRARREADEQLRNDKTDRNGLAEMLVAAALRLNDKVKLPKGK